MQFDLDAIDPTLPDVTIKIGGKTRRLTFDYKAIVLTEKLTKENLLSGLFEASFTSLAGMLFAALHHFDSDLKLEEVETWLNFKSAPVIHQALLTAWLGSVPTHKDEPGEAPAQDPPAA